MPLDDNNGELTNLQIERERERVFGRRGEGGAHIEMKDRRVTGALQWFWTVIGTAAVAGVYWVASSITSLNVNLERALVRMDYQDKRADLTDAQLRELQQEVAEMKGKVYRGDGSIKGFVDGR